tara:strand:+ start:20171 stop:20428 length:258 start_codon:yes stop_codon:yes gene_type:complete
MSDWVEILGKFGFPAAVALYLLWQTRKDKDALEKRLDGVEKFCREDLKQIAEDSTKVIAENNELIINNRKVLEKCTLELSKRDVA